jgi:hypothetical protein
MLSSRRCFCALLGPAIRSIHAQTREPVFRTKQRLVSFHLMVRDKAGEPVPIVSDENRSLLRIVVLIQNNRGVAHAVARIRKTGSLLMTMVAGSGAQVAVVSFSEEPRLLTGFTRDETKAAQLAKKLPLAGPGQ